MLRVWIWTRWRYEDRDENMGGGGCSGVGDVGGAGHGGR
jgi:hypothetical protein